MPDGKKETKLGLQLKYLMKERSLSMRKLSSLTGIDTATISRIINGKQPARIHHLQQLSSCLSVPVNDCLNLQKLFDNNQKSLSLI